MNQNQSEIVPAPEPTERGVLNNTGAEVAPEFEVAKEQAENLPAAAAEVAPKEPAAPSSQPSKIKKIIKPVPMLRDEMTVKVEKILSVGLADTYAKLSPVAQQEFKLKGEQTAIKIRELLQSAKIKVKKIFNLILQWLSLLPNINRFFLEQEAKIKTDRVIELKKQSEEKIHL
jgi:hypothetical protein